MVPSPVPVPVAVFPHLTAEQADGRACVVCFVSFAPVDGAPAEAVVVGRAGRTGGVVLACRVRCAPLVGFVERAGGGIVGCG
jgi:hypothetical protein